jgi:hypothetical protein
MTAKPDEQIPAFGEHADAKLSGESSGGGPRRLAPAASGLVAVVVFQLLFASVFLGVLHRPAIHHALSRWPGPHRWALWPAATAVARSG